MAVKEYFAFEKSCKWPKQRISLTQTFDRISLCVYNSLYSGVQKAKNGDRGTIVFTATLITTIMCDGVLHCLWFVFNVFLVSVHGD